jgi:hypothetical protein
LWWKITPQFAVFDVLDSLLVERVSHFFNFRRQFVVNTCYVAILLPSLSYFVESVSFQVVVDHFGADEHVIVSNQVLLLKAHHFVFDLLVNDVYLVLELLPKGVFEFLFVVFYYLVKEFGLITFKLRRGYSRD